MHKGNPMQITTVSSAAIQRNRARMRVGGIFHIGDKPQEDPAIARARRRAELKKGIRNGAVTLNFALDQAAIAGITDLAAFRLELLRELPIFSKLTDAEIQKRLDATHARVGTTA